MRYQLRRKLFAFGDDFTVKDETGADRYMVDGKVFSIGHKVIIDDMQGNEEATIHQHLHRNRLESYAAGLDRAASD